MHVDLISGHMFAAATHTLIHSTACSLHGGVFFQMNAILIHGYT